MVNSKKINRAELPKQACELAHALLERKFVTYSEISEYTNTCTPDAIRKYINRTLKTKKYSDRRPCSLDAIIKYCEENSEMIKRKYPELYNKYILVFNRRKSLNERSLVYKAYKNMYKMLRNSAKEVNYLKNLCGRYKLYRLSTGNKVVISELIIKIFDERHDDVIEYIHKKPIVEKNNEYIESDGIVFIMAGNIYLSGDINYGQAIEFIVLKKEKNHNNMKGIIITTCENDGEKLVASKCLIDRYFGDDGARIETIENIKKEFDVEMDYLYKNIMEL